MNEIQSLNNTGPMQYGDKETSSFIGTLKVSNEEISFQLLIPYLIYKKYNECV